MRASFSSQPTRCCSAVRPTRDSSRPGRSDPVTRTADRINAMPKYVASHTLTDAAWNSTILDGDVAAAVADLKAQSGENLLKFGTGELDRALIANGLVDEFHFWVFPVLAGTGQPLIEGIDVTHLELVETTPFASGIVVHTYSPK